MAVLDLENPDVPTVAAGRFGAVPGSVQSVPRAELYAAIQALKAAESPNITLFSDCKYFVDYSEKEPSLLRTVANGDLWDEFLKLSVNKNVNVVKVKAHCTLEDVRNGVIQWEHYVGNSYADTLAGEGAARAQVPQAIVDEMSSLDAMAWRIQDRLVAIVCAGTTKEQDKRDGLEHRRTKAARAHEGPDECQPCEEQQAQEQLAQFEEDLGPPEVPNRLGGERSSKLHISHTIRAGDGFVYCARCGSYATTRGRALLKDCPGLPKLTGRAVLKRIARGLTPRHSVRAR